MNYYVKEGSKVAYGDLVCSVDENGDVSNMINEASQDGSTIDSENLAEMRKPSMTFYMPTMEKTIIRYTALRTMSMHL